MQTNTQTTATPGTTSTQVVTQTNNNSATLREWFVQIGLVEKADAYTSCFVSGGYASLQAVRDNVPTNDILKDIGITVPAHRAKILNFCNLPVTYTQVTVQSNAKEGSSKQYAALSIKLKSVHAAVPDGSFVYVVSSLVADGDNIPLKTHGIGHFTELTYFAVSYQFAGPNPKFFRNQTLLTKACKFNTVARVHESEDWESLLVKFLVFQVQKDGQVRIFSFLNKLMNICSTLLLDLPCTKFSELKKETSSCYWNVLRKWRITVILRNFPLPLYRPFYSFC